MNQEGKEKKLITVLTTTYNRGYILPQLYESLKKQSSMNFGWFIIDDGSNDNSKALVTEWMGEDNKFPIEYVYKNNGGKHRAINFAVGKIHTPYIFLVDSDDQLVETAIQKVEEWLGTIHDKSDYAGVSGLRGYTKDKRIGQYPISSAYKKYIDATNIQRRKYKLLGDKAEIYRTDLLVKYPFPEIEGELFITESLVWNQIAFEGYKIRWFNEIIYLTEYLEDGLTKNLKKINWNNFGGYTMEVEQNISFERGIYKYIILGKYCNIAGKKKYGGRWICSQLHITRVQYLIGKLFFILLLIKEILTKTFNMATELDNK